MPFTLSHAAAALPFRRWRLVVPSALVIGTFAPDFEYLLRLSSQGRFGHTVLGSFVLTLPLALLVLWIFQAVVKQPAAALLPKAIQERLSSNADEFRFGGAARFVQIVASILLGIATHLLWDSFTHRDTWPYRHWTVLSKPFVLPIKGAIPLYKILQHGSTIVGMGIILAWLVHWYHTTKPTRFSPSLSSRQKAIIIAIIVAIALVGALGRAVIGIGMPTGHLVFNRFIVQAVVTGMALVWWQLVAYGFAARSTVRQRQL